MVLVLVTIAELARRDTFSWQSPINARENIIFIGAVGIFIYTIVGTKKRSGTRSTV